MATYKPFRELLKPGTNFEFIGRTRMWVTISILLSLATIGIIVSNHFRHGELMNWSTDFRGGTELIFEFNKAGSDLPAEVDSGQVRGALNKAGYNDVDVSDYSFDKEASNGQTVKARGMLVRTPDFGAVPAEVQTQVAADYAKAFQGTLKVSWSGDRLHVRSTRPVDWAATEALLGKHGLKLEKSDEDIAASANPEKGTGEFNAEIAVEGLDGQYRDAIQQGLGKDITVKVLNNYGVGAKAGAKLRNDGITSLFYAMLLIMLYLVVRFDIRYAPGAVIAMLHDAVIVIGAYALLWQEVSLTTVAAVLTVVGYSINDTVIIFDRIRENAHKLKDKKFGRVMNISINETLSRSLLTSMTVFVTTLMMNIFGTGLVRNFAFAMNVGVVTGTYSSIFIASPVALWIHNRYYSGPAEGGRAVRTTRPPAEEPIEESDEADDADEA